MELLFLLACFASAVTVVAIGEYRDARQLRKERDAALAAERDALGRLIAARKDGYEVPVEAPRPEPLVEEPVGYTPALQEYLDDWDGPSRVQAKAQVDAMLRLGMTQTDVVRRLRLEPNDPAEAVLA